MGRNRQSRKIVALYAFFKHGEKVAYHHGEMNLMAQTYNQAVEEVKNLRLESLRMFVRKWYDDVEKIAITGFRLMEGDKNILEARIKRQIWVSVRGEM